MVVGGRADLARGLGRAREGAAELNRDAQAFGRAIRDRFPLEPGIAFLNHGSFGAVPLDVTAAADAWRRRMEASPDRFFRRELPGLLRASAARLAAAIGARGDDLVFVENATTGVNAVMRSLRLEPGDEIVTTTHAYGAVRKALAWLAARTGARVTEVAIPAPVSGADEIVRALDRALARGARLVVVDHVTSPTAIVFPIERIAAAARAKGAAVLVDGAHAPGMLPLDVPALGADWYVGNCHKWLFAPRGCAFLWSAPAARHSLHPTSISHGYGGGFLAEFDWTGTRDFSAWLALPTALEFVASCGGAERIRAYNRALLAEAVMLLARAWGTPIAAPPALRSGMATLALPPALGGGAGATAEAAAGLMARLYDEHRIVVAIMAFGDRLWARISAQIYNEIGDYRRLADLAA